MRVEPGLSLAKADMKAIYLWAMGEVLVPSRAHACLSAAIGMSPFRAKL